MEFNKETKCLGNKVGLSNFDTNTSRTLSDRIKFFFDYTDYRTTKQHNNYRICSTTGSGARMQLINPYSGKEQDTISFVSNDYLGFSKHPKVIKAGIDALKKYGSGSGASPLIGGLTILHEELEKKIAFFFEKEAAITFTSGFAANAGVLPALLGKQGVAILDTKVHASVIDGCYLTNKKFFLHNDIGSLEHVLKFAFNTYIDKVVVVDGVYSQDGDISPLDKIYSLVKKYKAYLIVDDAHGVGIFGEKARGIIEDFNLLKKVDLITGTFSKTFGTVGGYAAGSLQLINYLRYYSRMNIFSAAATPQSLASILCGINLLHEEPFWQTKIISNIRYFREGLENLKIDYGNSQSAIFPIMIRDEEKTNDAAKILFENDVYVNPITQPAVKKKESRLRMSVLAVHEKNDLDKTLNLLEYVIKKLSIK